MVQCTGCYRDFSASGYTFHVTRTINTVCRATYRSQLGSRLQHDELDDNDNNDNNDLDDDDDTWETDSLHGLCSEEPIFVDASDDLNGHTAGSK
jgi:hypothetical protein